MNACNIKQIDDVEQLKRELFNCKVTSALNRGFWKWIANSLKGQMSKFGNLLTIMHPRFWFGQCTTLLKWLQNLWLSTLSSSSTSVAVDCKTTEAGPEVNLSPEPNEGQRQQQPLEMENNEKQPQRRFGHTQLWHGFINIKSLEELLTRNRKLLPASHLR